MKETGGRLASVKDGRAAWSAVVVLTVVGLVCSHSVFAWATVSRLRADSGSSTPKLTVAHSVVIVSGLSGRRTAFTIRRTVEMDSVGLDSDIRASSGRWVGVYVARIDHRYSYFASDWYAHYKLTQALLCPGERCPLPRFADGVGGGTHHNLPHGEYTFELPPGRYAAILLGDRGAHISVTLRLHGLPSGTVRLTAGGQAHLESRFVKPQVAGGRHQAVSRGYFWRSGGPRFDGLAIGFVLSTPAAANWSVCVTPGPAESRPPPESKLCLVGSSSYPIFFTNIDTVAYGVGYTMGTIPRDGSLGLGYDAETFAARSRLIGLWFSVSPS